ncbi:hypothetical protein Tco_0943270, partial [Tanacetum coccineum]
YSLSGSIFGAVAGEAVQPLALSLSCQMVCRLVPRLVVCRTNEVHPALLRSMQNQPLPPYFDEGEPTGSTALEATIATGSGKTVRSLSWMVEQMVTTGSHSLSWMVEHMVLEKLRFARVLN